MNQNLQISDFNLPAGAAPLACVDIGGTRVAVSVVDAQGMRGRVAEPTAHQGAADAVALQVLRLLEQSCQVAGIAVADVAALGVSACGPFLLRNGVLELAAPNICGGIAGPARGLPNDWQSALLEAPLRRVFPRVRVEIDAIAALVAEQRWGALQVSGQALAHCAYVTWSTGIGFGLYADAAALFAAALAGDAKATAIIDELCRVMGRTLYNLIVTLDLQRISIGGSVFWNNRDWLLPRLRAAVRGKLSALTEGCELVAAGLGDRVGDFAALALVV